MKKVKKAFTLIELLAVIIILAIVALIATPLILNVIDDAEKSANRSQVELLLGAAENLYAQSYLNEDLKAYIDVDNIYGNLKTSGELPPNGKLKIQSDGKIELSVFIDNVCYTKGIDDSKIQVLEGENVTADSCVPLSITISPNQNLGSGWFGEDITLSISSNGTGFKYKLEESADYTVIDTNNGTVILTETTTVYAVPIRDGAEGEEVILEYKIDKTVPTITAKADEFTIQQGENVDLTTYFDTTFGPSNGSIVCNPSSTANLTVDNNTLTCKVVGNNGIESTEVSKTINVEAPCDDSAVTVALTEGLIPVVIAPDGTVTKADASNTNDTYHNYCRQQWANAVMIKDDVNRASYQNATEGTTIELDSIAAYYVWIPRYEYKIFDVDDIGGSGLEKVIDVKFVSNTEIKKTTPALNGFYTHPAFTFGDTEVNGIWVGKFEMTGSKEMPTIQPNQESLVNLNVSEFFYSIYDMDNDYKVINVDSHMLKNMEWGAVAYLSYSRYGIRTDIRNNNFITETTGCGSVENIDGNSSTCILQYGTQTTDDYPQSTTGNISGLFDMAGGVREYVMGSQVTYRTANSGLSDDFFDDSSNAKYYDRYNNSSSIITWSRGAYGDATKEIIGWYSDLNYFASNGGSWFLRGGKLGSLHSGILAFDNEHGEALLDSGSRSSLVVYP